MPTRRILFSTLAAFVLLMPAIPAAWATTAPSDPCSLPAAGDVSTATGAAYSVPESNAAPKPYPSSGPGTDCRYKGDGATLFFRIYFDASPDAATALFNQLKMFYPAVSSPSGLGDDAYFDKGNGLHVRKGNVRFFLSGHPSNAQLQAMAAIIAGKV